MNIVQLALSVEKLAQERPALTVEPKLCLRARNKKATCDVCVTGCPVGAIKLGEGGPQVDLETCIRCGVCLHLCPTGVFSGRDGVDRLLQCVEQAVDHEVIELACAAHPDLVEGDKGIDAVIRTTGCLSALGPSAYVGLAALGVRETRVRLDACASCPLAALKPEIERAIGEASALLTSAERPKALTIAPPAKGKKTRAVISAKHPPVSRRGFFQALALQPSKAAEELATADEAQHIADKDAPRERRRLIRALQRIAPATAAPISGSGFVQMAVSETCTACDVCARSCPTGALTVRRDDNEFAVLFSASACNDCGLCLPFCEPHALTRAGTPTLAALLAGEPQVLAQGAMRRCTKCHALFAGPADDDLCPVCRFRQRQPFGARWPSARDTPP